MRSMRVPALVLSVLLLSSAGAMAYQDMASARKSASSQNTELQTAAANSQVLISEEFERAGAIGLLTAQDDIFTDFFKEPGSTLSKVNADGPVRNQIVDLLAYVQTLFPGSVARSGYFDAKNGQEIAEVVNNLPSPPITLEPNADKKLPFFGSVASLPKGWIYQSTPYFSKETDEWVVANATTIGVNGEQRGVFYFELRLDALRAQALKREGNATMRAVTERNGLVVFDSRMSQASQTDFAEVNDDTFTNHIQDFGASGLTTLGEERVAYERMVPSETLHLVNDNHWYITASEPAVQTGLVVALTPLFIALVALGVPLLVFALISYARMFRRNRRLRREAEEERDHLNARLGDLTTALDQAANGNLAVQLPVDFDDERLAALAQSFDSTLERLRALVAQAQGHGVQLAQSAGQLRATAQEQAGSAAEQSAVVAETTATIEELAATAAQIAETAGSVARVASETLVLTDEGRGAVGESVAAMESLQLVVGQIGTSSAGLGDKIAQVGQILALIDELSEQTNLLALNAAIEAARAGEHGRGFAVVAAEVRKLAERAQESTSQIQSIVTEIQAHTRSTVMASEEGARAVTASAGKAAGAVTALEKIATMVDEATAAAEEISIATQQQRSASDQVVVAMTQVSDASRQYAAGSKQTAAASSQIATLAAAMQDSIATFSVTSDDAEPSRGAGRYFADFEAHGPYEAEDTLVDDVLEDAVEVDSDSEDEEVAAVAFDEDVDGEFEIETVEEPLAELEEETDESDAPTAATDEDLSLH